MTSEATTVSSGTLGYAMLGGGMLRPATRDEIGQWLDGTAPFMTDCRPPELLRQVLAPDEGLGVRWVQDVEYDPEKYAGPRSSGPLLTELKWPSGFEFETVAEQPLRCLIFGF